MQKGKARWALNNLGMQKGPKIIDLRHKLDKPRDTLNRLSGQCRTNSNYRRNTEHSSRSKTVNCRKRGKYYKNSENKNRSREKKLKRKLFRENVRKVA